MPRRPGSLNSRLRPVLSIMRMQGTWPSSSAAYQSIGSSKPASSGGRAPPTERLCTQVWFSTGEGMASIMMAASSRSAGSRRLSGQRRFFRFWASHPVRSSLRARPGRVLLQASTYRPKVSTTCILLSLAPVCALRKKTEGFPAGSRKTLVPPRGRLFSAQILSVFYTHAPSKSILFWTKRRSLCGQTRWTGAPPPGTGMAQCRR